jgi:cytochrome P450
VFSSALSPNLDKGQFHANPEQLAADSVLFYLAGTDTTAHALIWGIWNMVKRSELWRRLQDEVRPLMKEVGEFADVRNLEMLPFLVSV